MTAWQGKPKSLISQRWRAPPGICEQGHGSSPTPPQSHGGTDPQRAGGISSHDQVSTEAGPSFLPSESSRVWWWRSEEHTSELQSRLHLVCRLLLEKKKKYSVQPELEAVRKQRDVTSADIS